MAEGLTLIVNNLIAKLAATRSERDEHLRLAAALDDEAGKIKNAIWGLSGLIEQSELEQIREQHRELFDDYLDSNLGLTEAVRRVLKTTKKWMSPVAVKNAVMKITHVLDSHRNPLGSIHTTLKRLADANEIITALEPDGRTLYGWGGDEETVRSLIEDFPEEDANQTLKMFEKNWTVSAVKPARSQPKAKGRARSIGGKSKK